VKPAPILVYSVLRLLAFLLPLAILWYFFPIFRELWWLAAIFAALIGVSISMLFLRSPLSEASADFYARRRTRTTAGQRDADAGVTIIVLQAVSYADFDAGAHR
jgi:hypothetical protein